VITYKLDTNGIMQVVFTGSIGYKDIADWLVVFSNLPDLPPKINLLYDMKNANLMLDMVKLIQITKKTEEATKKFEKVRTAFVLTESGLSTYSVLFSFLDVSGRTTRKVFTDLKKATEWLLKEDF
jgi:hypothetical protein